MNPKSVGVRWVFNGSMLCGAVLGIFIVWGCEIIWSAYHHRGSGMVFYEGPDGEDRTRKEPEAQYKREKYVEGGFVLLLGLVVWYGMAKAANNHDVLQAAQYEAALALAKSSSEYQFAFHAALAEVIGSIAYANASSVAETKAKNAPAYLAAKKISDEKQVVSWAAWKAIHRDS